MRQFLLGLSISLAFILGCVTAQQVPELAMPSASAYSGQRWEYTCQPTPTNFVDTERAASAASEFLNRHGTGGWEIVPYAFEVGFACFKRPA